MRAGSKNRRIRVEVLQADKNSFGTETETWNLLREVWAAMASLPEKAQETHQAEEVLSEMFVEFRIDYIAGLSPKANRIVFEGQIYDIHHIYELGYREALVIKTRLLSVAGIGGYVGIDGTAAQSAPPSVAQLTRMGTYSASEQPDGTVTIIAYSEYLCTIEGLNNLCTTTGTTRLTVKVNGISVTGLTDLLVSSTPQNPVATGGNIVNVGDQVDCVFSNSNTAVGVKFTIKGSVAR